MLTWCSFGWVNASYILGLSIVNAHMRRALSTMTTWETFERATEETEIYAHEMGGRHQLDAQGAGFLEQGHSGSAHFKRNGEGSTPLHPAQSHPVTG